jgi:putative oxidoreductase
MEGMLTMETNLSKFQPQVLSILRIIAGLLFLSSGLQKWFGFPIANPNFANITLISMIGIAGLIETVGGVLVTVVYTSRGLHNVGRDGSGVLVLFQPSGEGFYADPEWRHLEVLFCFVFFYFKGTVKELLEQHWH